MIIFINSFLPKFFCLIFLRLYGIKERKEASGSQLKAVAIVLDLRRMSHHFLPPPQVLNQLKNRHKRQMHEGPGLGPQAICTSKIQDLEWHIGKGNTPHVQMPTQPRARRIILPHSSSNAKDTAQGSSLYLVSKHGQMKVRLSLLGLEMKHPFFQQGGWDIAWRSRVDVDPKAGSLLRKHKERKKGDGPMAASR